MVSGVGVLDKSMAVLSAVEAGAGSLAELVAATGQSRATTHRLAVALESHGMLRRDASGRFVLGWRLVGLGRAAAEGQGLVSAAAPVLRRLRDATGESAQLYVPDGDHRICVASLESPHGLRTIVDVGAVLPIGVGSAGRVLLGELEGSRREWLESVGQREAGVASVSAPVHGPDGVVVAAIGVSGPIERTTRQPGRRYGDAVAAAATALEAAVGLPPGAGPRRGRAGWDDAAR
jgi:DNA-binding IclR family transcriptional regulator